MRQCRHVDAVPQARAAFDRYQFARAAGLRELIELGVRDGEFAPCNAQVIAEVVLGAALRLRRPDALHALCMRSACARPARSVDEAYALTFNGMLKDTSEGKPNRVSRFRATRHFEVLAQLAVDASLLHSF